MLRPRFLWKLYASYLALLIFTTAIIGALVARQTSQEIHQTVRHMLQTRALLLRELALQIFDASEPPSWAAHLQSQAMALGTQITLIRSDGTVVADSEDKPSHLQNHAGRPEIAAARQRGAIGTDIRMSPRFGESTMYLARPVRRQGELLGYIRTAMPLTMLRERLAHVWRTVMIVGSGAAVIGLLFSLLFARQVADPLRRMTDVATQLAGQYAPQPAFMRTKDEIEDLTNAFDRMARNLRDRMETIIKDRNQLLTVLGGMVEGVIAVDENEFVTHMNQAAGTILQVNPETSIGKHIWEVTRVRAVIETLDSTINDAENITCEVNITRPRERTLKLNASPLRDSRGTSIGAVMVLHDVTDIRRLENIRRDFVANVSHELKTPITTIKGFVETLRDGAIDDREHAHRFLDIIANNGDRLHAIIEDLLSLSRLEQTEQIAGLVCQETVLNQVIEQAVRGCGAKAESRQVTVTIACDPDLRLSVNASLMEQAIVNLLDNAINYSKAGSTIHIAASRQSDEIAVSVQDEGIGIPQEHLPRLFERFYRVDKARSRERGGTGLGLAIVKHIAQVHGGHVSVVSTLGEGSTFTLRLPVA
jgi:two-component system phosphate regulon sensor histidine kinase PhoR